MFIKIDCVDYTSDKKTVEICSFRGIRYDYRTNVAILSTEHDRHDYIFPLSEPNYERLVSELELAARSNANIVRLEKGQVFRCKKGQMRRADIQNDITAQF